MAYTFTSHEVKTEIDSLQELIGMRLGNIHQIDKDTLLIKFWKLGVSRHLVIENGVRFHLTEFPREKPKTPPDFCCRLRKFLRFRKLDDIIQPLNDRAVIFRFGELSLCLELFLGGNIILFNQRDLTIHAVMKYHIISGKTIIGVNQPYNYEQFKSYIPPNQEDVFAYFQNLEPGNSKVRGGFSKLFPFMRQEFFVHSMIKAGMNPDITNDKFVFNPEQVHAFYEEMKFFENYLLTKPEPRPMLPETPPEEYEKAPKAPAVPLPPKPKGYIFTDKKTRTLSCYKLAQWEEKKIQEYSTFDLACDDFWSAKELETAQKARIDNDLLPERKVKGVQKNFDKKKKQLQNEIEGLTSTGELIGANAQEIEQCIMILNSFISNHVRWDEIRASIRAYQESGNELAAMIDKVEFEKKAFWVLLNSPEGKTVRVLIDLKLSAYANMSSYYDKRIALYKKLESTIAKETDVLKKVDKEAQANKKKIPISIQEKRKTWWFERFHWFVTSENYLVVAGRDKIQNDVLVKHYLKKDDIYLHAEIHGAASVIIKNPLNIPVSPISIQQAAEFAVARSSAWKSNEPCQCFWVYANQVKKIIQGQQMAPTGSFYIVGEKNMLHMTMPQMGLAILFHVTEAHVSSHMDERRRKIEDEDAPVPVEDEKGPTVRIRMPPRMSSSEIMNILPFSGQNEETNTMLEKSDSEYTDSEEDIDDDELIRKALTEPERADVAERREQRKAKRNKPKVKPEPVESEVAEVMAEEGIPVDLDVSGINGLTGIPNEDDEFYAAYAMCAPLSAINTYKFKVKFSPGELKKGKVWPMVSNYFASLKVKPEQAGLIKLIPEGDVVNQLPFNVKLTLGAGGSSFQNNKKPGKKKGK